MKNCCLVVFSLHEEDDKNKKQGAKGRHLLRPQKAHPRHELGIVACERVYLRIAEPEIMIRHLPFSDNFWLKSEHF